VSFSNSSSQPYNVFQTEAVTSVPTSSRQGTGGGSMNAWSETRINKYQALVRTTFSMGTTAHTVPTGVSYTNKAYDVGGLPNGEQANVSISSSGRSGSGGGDMYAWLFPRQKKLNTLVTTSFSLGTSNHSIPTAFTTSQGNPYDVGFPAGELKLINAGAGGRAGTGGGPMPTWSYSRQNKIDALVKGTFSMGTSTYSLSHAFGDSATNPYNVGFPAGEAALSQPTKGVTVGYNYFGIEAQGHVYAAKAGQAQPTNPIAVTDATISAIGPQGSASTQSFSTAPAGDASFHVPISNIGDWKIKAERQYLTGTESVVTILNNNQSIGTFYMRLPSGGGGGGISYRNITIGLD